MEILLFFKRKWRALHSEYADLARCTGDFHIAAQHEKFAS